ncbi:TorD/DmsD family molecular chaperone [Halorhodospira halophila]|uniref:Cytoplasmic chaperone TorD family protein n=1 Tax=Halorhodospira halophila (strain DSM 244 / SL1) TaxID=349124 RepID=A1WTY8_HALHL|nr:molecular chaperone TorD family protein [Halorhodospira halophila]ABM61150.1 cytoplasmic chaperone TorD family protein [Halorhodospira halophila SL1]MBK1729657.1 hypothetical protein [Halorhodospira halophila]
MATTDSTTERAELYLCLSRAFVTPHAEGFLPALAEDLPADLEALLGADDPGGERIATLRRAARALPDTATLRRGYTALFLNPPYRAPLNAGLQLEGAINGAVVQAIRACYQRHGLDRAESFRDLPDHLAAQLEFVAYLWAQPTEAETTRQLRNFLERYVTPWLPRLIGQLKAELPHQPAAALYLALAEITRHVADADHARLPAPQTAGAHRAPTAADTARISAAEQVATEQQTAEVAVACPRCQAAVTLRGSQAAVYRRLQGAGVTAEHLCICRDCQAQGLSPAPRKY